MSAPGHPVARRDHHPGVDGGGAGGGGGARNWVAARTHHLGVVASIPEKAGVIDKLTVYPYGCDVKQMDVANKIHTLIKTCVAHANDPFVRFLMSELKEVAIGKTKLINGMARVQYPNGEWRNV